MLIELTANGFFSFAFCCIFASQKEIFTTIKRIFRHLYRCISACLVSVSTSHPSPFLLPVPECHTCFYFPSSPPQVASPPPCPFPPSPISRLSPGQLLLILRRPFSPVARLLLCPCLKSSCSPHVYWSASKPQY